MPSRYVLLLSILTCLALWFVAITVEFVIGGASMRDALAQSAAAMIEPKGKP